MQLSLLIIAAFAAFTSAVNIIGYPTFSCTGHQRWSCLNIPSGHCCRFRVDIRSVKWSLPARAGGLAYPGLQCNGRPYPAASGTRCGGYGPAAFPVRSIKWLAGYFPRPMAGLESQPEASGDGVDASVFTFTHNGETTVLNVPQDSMEKVVDLAAKENYEGLKALGKDWPSVSGDSDPDPSVEHTDYTFVEG